MKTVGKIIFNQILFNNPDRSKLVKSAVDKSPSSALVGIPAGRYDSKYSDGKKIKDEFFS